MKALVCEMCNSNDLVKQDGYFVCQCCGTKYSVEEARKLMIEGKVDVSGSTVKIDNSERVKNSLIKAERAFSDKKFEQAADLYSQILNEEPNNHIAILYEGISIGWQGNLVRYNLKTACDATNRSFEIAINKFGNTKEYQDFMLEAIKCVTELCIGYLNLCFENIRDALEDFNSTMNDLNYYRETMDIVYGDANDLMRQGDLAKKRLDDEYAKNNKIIDNSIVIAMSCYKFGLNLITELVEFDSSFFKTLKKYANELKPNEATPISYGEVSTVIDMIHNLEISSQKAKEEAKRKEKQKRLDKYWSEHKDEKEKLEKELEELNGLKESLSSKISEIENGYNIQIASLKKQCEATLEIEEKCLTLNSNIYQLTKELNSLGLFKGKEKRSLKEKIEIEKKNLRESEIEKESQIEKRKKEINNKISNLQNAMNDETKEFRSELSEIQSRINEINAEFTKDR